MSSDHEPTILLVEDDATLRRSLLVGLADQGYAVQSASHIASARKLLSEQRVDLVLLDLGLPDGNGLDLLRELREEHKAMPVLILTARDTVPDKVEGFDLGADDYLVKPFDFLELSARIRAHLRRSTDPQGTMLNVADLSINLIHRHVHRAGVTIECTPREYDVLVYLAKTPGQVISRQLLTTDVWNIHSRLTSMDNVIDVTLSRLREKVDRDHDQKLIHTVRGLGYMMKDLR